MAPPGPAGDEGGDDSAAGSVEELIGPSLSGTRVQRGGDGFELVAGPSRQARAAAWARMWSSSSQDGCRPCPGAAAVSVRMSVDASVVEGMVGPRRAGGVDRRPTRGPQAGGDGEGAPPPATGWSGCVVRTSADCGSLQVTHILRREGLAADPPVAAVDLLDRDPRDGAHGLALDLDHGVGQLLDHLLLLVGVEDALDQLDVDE